MNTVAVTNFSSVLEIAFGMNFLFLFFELRPSFDKRLWGFAERFQKTLGAAWEEQIDTTKGLLHRLWPTFIKLTMWQVFYVSIDAAFILVSAIASALALGFLIASGFNPQFSLEKLSMWILLAFELLPTPIYYLLVGKYIQQAELSFTKAAKKYKTGEDQNISQSNEQ